ncbi:type II secretion system minor pseudopilin GspJ [Spongiibacter nanhainus]|uniref:Type II secretion system protein J n=1 Tax=Spongiibacter nanhainus TaxID=2794344 RepID=A0A7T4QYB3_9GAMM|nr:type II secretion system minor pseudopilin GspJ [Spongiibacter nanhainus]QQD16909.1 type II secretion system minor pseudopilin GspJ [Spongiibacter nanhainus]
MTTSFRQANTDKGFTLVELLIAIGIMALLGAAAAAMLNGAIDNKQRIEARQQKLERVALALQILRRDLEQLTPRIARDRAGDPLQSRIVGEQVDADSEVEFVHGGRRILPGQSLGSALERVRYLSEDEALVRYSAAVADPTDNTDWHRQVLLDKVENFTVSYYDGERWTTFWPPSTQLNAIQPQGVRIEMDVSPWPGIRLDVVLPELP